MFFIRPTILRDEAQTAFETNQKYNYIRDLQLSQETTPKLLPSLEPEKPSVPEDPAESPEEDENVIDLRKLDTQQPKTPAED